MKRITSFGMGVLSLLGCGGTVETGAGGAGTTGTTSTTTTSTTTTTTTTTSTSSSSSSGSCDASNCSAPFVCCAGACVNPDNDILNCGKCGTVCSGGSPYCDHGTCGTPPCTTPQLCGAGGTCCGNVCCKPGELCCDVPGPIAAGPVCQPPDPMTMTCDKGCPLCVCASPETPIATPDGDRAIADLRPGDLVYSVEGEAVVAVPIARVNRAPVQHHQVVRVALANGRVLSVSAPHPTADGRTFGDLRAGDALDGTLVLSAELVPYAFTHTYDILPASSTGAYYAGGALIGSTLTP